MHQLPHPLPLSESEFCLGNLSYMSFLMQKERVELQKSFSSWKIRHSDDKREVSNKSDYCVSMYHCHCLLPPAVLHDHVSKEPQPQEAEGPCVGRLVWSGTGEVEAKDGESLPGENTSYMSTVTETK